MRIKVATIAKGFIMLGANAPSPSPNGTRATHSGKVLISRRGECFFAVSDVRRLVFSSHLSCIDIRDGDDFQRETT